MNRIFYYIIPLFLLLAACKGDEPVKTDEPTPRAVLVYMVANNNLTRYDSYDIDEMKKAATDGSFGKSRLLIYHHAKGTAPALKEITANGKTVILKDYDTSIPSVSAKRMNEVIADFKTFAPATSYGLIVWGHGSGWWEDGIDESVTQPEPKGTVAPQSIGYDTVDDEKYWMNITTLADVLKGKGFDYIYFDCCYMAAIEVAYQMRNVTDYIIASATELPIYGMPYDQNLRYLMPKEPKLEEACRHTIEHYRKNTDGFNASNGCPVTISLIKTAEIAQLASITLDIYSQKPTLPDDYKPQQFYDPYNGGSRYVYDFGHYMNTLAENTSNLSKWNQALESSILFKDHTDMIWDNIPIKFHSGLSTYIISGNKKPSFKNYTKLDWWTDIASKLFAGN